MSRLVPDILDDDLLELVVKIRPLFKERDGYREILVKRDVERLRRTSFIWSPKLGRVVKVGLPKETIRTYHTCGHPVLFKPSIAEVLAQLTPEQRKWCKAFHVEDELGRSNVVEEGDHHWTFTHLFA